MPERIVVGLYSTQDSAEDARHRLIHEGIPRERIEIRVLREIASIPTTALPLIRDFSIDFFFGTTVKRKYAALMHNEETAVCVPVESEAEARIASDVLSMFVPLLVDVLSPATEEELLRQETAAVGPTGIQ